jgi:hypothetical protein
MAARELAMAGAEAFDKQDFATALDRFQRAESLYKVPSISVMVARCLARVGRVVEAVDKYEETLRVPLDAAAPEAFQRAVAEASAEVDVARARVSRLELRLPSDAPTDGQVMLDSKPVPPALLGVPIPLDPGAHRVVARAAGRRDFVSDVTLSEGGRQALAISFGSVAARTPVAPTGEAVKGRPVSALSIALLAGGGVGIAAGAVTGIAALKHKSKLDDACNPGCAPTLASDVDAFRLDRTLSYLGFGLGLAAAGAGTYFLLFDDSNGSQVGALVLPGGAALAGRF